MKIKLQRETLPFKITSSLLGRVAIKTPGQITLIEPRTAALLTVRLAEAQGGQPSATDTVELLDRDGVVESFRVGAAHTEAFLAAFEKATTPWRSRWLVRAGIVVAVLWLLSTCGGPQGASQQLSGLPAAPGGLDPTTLALAAAAGQGGPAIPAGMPTAESVAKYQPRVTDLPAPKTPLLNCGDIKPGPATTIPGIN